MMRNLPVPVEEEEIEAMFEFADKDKDGKINYRHAKRSLMVPSWMILSDFYVH